ncbi:MAG: hypothetical protein GWN07_11990, partial [Actinobacteria bacterium]|nr:hypothetical protein [Actinomycetota bacterium]NIS35008.1 hypothetical protein [Actinomycetota bacterium]NIT97859.1 hypothetical protein [Actinomycetota bacterium]NIU71011.1 hypothetical protein [Actinomycetota bacterium]NIV89571.1 hypothetical protein [Actinomycetota bacterium]
MTTTVPPDDDPGGIEVQAVSSLDPYGDGAENDELVPLLVDGDPETAWRTERYPDGLAAVKQGVGV